MRHFEMHPITFAGFQNQILVNHNSSRFKVPDKSAYSPGFYRGIYNGISLRSIIRNLNETLLFFIF